MIDTVVKCELLVSELHSYSMATEGIVYYEAALKGSISAPCTKVMFAYHVIFDFTEERQL